MYEWYAKTRRFSGQAFVVERCNHKFAAQHVSDLLRDKLQNLGVELIDSKSRIFSLEQSHTADRDALRVSNSKLSESCTSLLMTDIELQ